MRRAVLPLFLSVALGGLSAQQPPVRTITTGVVVDVTVVDGKGNPVLDLAPEDFELAEDGTRQRIVSATLVRSGIIKPLNVTTVAGAEPGAQPAASASTSASAGTIAPSVTAILF